MVLMYMHAFLVILIILSWSNLKQTKENDWMRGLLLGDRSTKGSTSGSQTYVHPSNLLDMYKIIFGPQPASIA